MALWRLAGHVARAPGGARSKAAAFRSAGVALSGDIGSLFPATSARTATVWAFTSPWLPAFPTVPKHFATTHEYQTPEVNSMSLGTTTCEACGSAAPLKTATGSGRIRPCMRPL